MSTKIDFLLLGGEMFGLQVNDYSQQQVGQYGFGIKLNIADYKPLRIDFVQGSKEPLSISAPVTSNLTLATLQALPDSENCPELSWCWLGETLHIVFNETAYDYADDDCRFAFGGIRYPMLVDENTDLVDAPDEYLKLLLAYARRYAWLLKKKMVDRDIQKIIEEEQNKIIG